MNSIFFNYLQSNLPKQSWTWVIAALRHDNLVWETIQSETTNIHSSFGNIHEPESWNPALVAFMVMGQTIPTANATISLGLRQRAFRCYETVIQQQHNPSGNIQPMLQAALLAISLRERIRLSGKWEDLIADISSAPLSVWQTPFSCLYGLIENPQDLLDTLFTPGLSPDIYKLGLHALLSNPQPRDNQVSQLQRLVEKLPLSDQYIIFTQLITMRPALGAELAHHLKTNFTTQPQYYSLDILTHHVRQAEIALITQEKNTASTAIANAQNSARLLQARLASHSAQVNGNELTALQKAFELAPEDPVYRARLALKYIDINELTEARAILDPSYIDEHPFLLFAFANIEMQYGDIDKAREYGLQAAKFVEAYPVTYDTHGQPGYSFLLQLTQILLTMKLPFAAIRTGEIATREYIDDPEPVALLGEAQTAAGQYLKAAESFQLAVLLDPENTDYHRKLAKCYEIAGDWKKAMSEREKIIAGPISEVSDSYALAECAIQSSRPEYALDICNNVLSTNPDDAMVYTLQGEAWTALGNYDKSQECFTKATEINPSLIRPWLSLATTNKKNNQQQKALDVLRMASQAIPGSPDIHLTLGMEYSSTGSLTQALASFQRAEEIDPENVSIGLRLGQTLYQLGHTQQAFDILTKAYYKDPSNIQIAKIYAHILLQLDEPHKALPALETVMQSNPNDPESLFDYASVILLTHGDVGKATQSLQHALELDPNYYEAQALLGDALAEETRYVDSLKAYQTAMETPIAQNPQWHMQLSYGLGKVAIRLGMPEMAITSLLDAVQADPQNYRPHCLLAEAYANQGLTPDSYHSAREALRLAGDDFEVMIWFVETALKLLHNGNLLLNLPGEENINNEEIRLHAMNILAHASDIVPAEPAMLLRLASVQADTGNKSGALKSYRKVESLESASLAELQSSAQGLLQLSDINGAVICYEKALDKIKDPKENGAVYTSLLTHISDAYRKIQLLDSSLNAINKAITYNPTDIELCLRKSQILVEMQDTNSALDYLTEITKKSPNPRLYFFTSLIFVDKGELIKALEYAEAGANIYNPEISAENQGYIECVILALEIAQALLHNNYAIKLLNTHAPNIDKITSEIAPLFYLTSSELALNSGEEIEAANYLNKALDKLDNHLSSLMALQARFTARRGDYSAALNTFNQAYQELGIEKSQNIFQTSPSINAASIQSSGANIKKPSWYTIFPIINAAIELNQWGVALRLAQNGVKATPKVPLAYVNILRILVLRAEFQILCQEADLIQHAPGPVALSEGTCNAFDQALKSCLNLYEDMDQATASISMPPSLEQWNTRGKALFHPSEQTVQSLVTWASQSSNSDDIAAAISSLRHHPTGNELPSSLDNRTASAVLTQTALFLAEKQPQEAIKALQLAILNEPTPNIANAIRHYLLARLTHDGNSKTSLSAIQNALSLLPDEPRWNALAASIFLNQGDRATAINHLENAIEVEPHNYTHHLKLGKLYIEAAEQGSSDDGQMAIKYFEHVCRLDPKFSEGWLLLARAYHIADNIEQAASAAKQAATLDPENAIPFMIQAELALQVGKYQQAYDFAKVSVEKNPGSYEAALIFSKVLQALNRPAEALAVIDKSIPFAEQTIPMIMERMRLIKLSQGSESALQAVKQIAELKPDDPIVFVLLAESLADVGQDDDAIRISQKALLLGESLSIEQQANIRLILGRTLRRAGQLDQAIHHLNEAIQLTPNKIEPIIELGRTHQDRRQQAQALLMYRHAANIAPNDPRPYFQAGLALKEGKDYCESESMLRRAAELAPNDPTIRRQLAAVIAINLVHNPHHPLQTETL